MSINNHWRNKQLGANTLWQETVCEKFLQQHPSIHWSWHGLHGNFYHKCCQKYNIGNGTGRIIINHPVKVTPAEFVRQVNEIISGATAVYLAVNRYEFVAVNDLNINYPESLADTIDQIVAHLCLPFSRLIYRDDVEGNSFVGVHGLDIFKYAAD